MDSEDNFPLDSITSENRSTPNAGAQRRGKPPEKLTSVDNFLRKNTNLKNGDPDLNILNEGTIGSSDQKFMLKNAHIYVSRI